MLEMVIKEGVRYSLGQLRLDFPKPLIPKTLSKI